MRSVTLQILRGDGSVLFETSTRKFPYIIGRDREGDLYIDDKTCSKVHASLEERNDELWLIDRESRNGSFNDKGERIKEVRLEDTLRVRLGNTWLRLELKMVEQSTTAVLPQTVSSSNEFPSLSEAPENHVFEIEEVDSNISHEREENREASIRLEYQREQNLREEDIISYEPEPIKVDRVEKILNILSDTKLIVLSIIALQFALLLKAPASDPPRVLQERAVLGTLAVFTFAFALSYITNTMAKMLKNSRSNREIAYTYVSILGFLLSAYILSENSKLLWPNGGYIHFTSTLLTMCLLGLIGILNLKWIVNSNDKTIFRFSIFFALIILYEANNVQLYDIPRWKELKTSLDMDLLPKKVPPHFYVDTNRLVSDIDLSIQTLAQPSTQSP